MRKSNSFKVPEKYFENIDVEILEKLKFKKNVFTFPQNYFENIGYQQEGALLFALASQSLAESKKVTKKYLSYIGRYW